MVPAPTLKAALAALLLVGVAACSGSPTPEGPTAVNAGVAATDWATPTDPATSTMPDREAFAEDVLSFQQRKAECLRERGWDVSDPDPNALGNPMVIQHGGRPEELRAAREECAEELGGEPTAPLADDAELSKFYDLQVEAYECLVANGYSPAPPSTREAFVASYYAGESWFAHQPAVPEGAPIPDTVCPQPMLADIEW